QVLAQKQCGRWVSKEKEECGVTLETQEMERTDELEHTRFEDESFAHEHEAEAHEHEDERLDLTPGVEDTPDPVRTYLREMGTVPLLKKEGEIALAKRIEQGEGLVLKAISRSPILLEALTEAAAQVREGERTIGSLIPVDPEKPAEAKAEERR